MHKLTILKYKNLPHPRPPVPFSDGLDTRPCKILDPIPGDKCTETTIGLYYHGQA